MVLVPAEAGLARAASPVPVLFGTSSDGASNSLQNILNAKYGLNKIKVATDYIGAKPSDPDPWHWQGPAFTHC